MELVAAGGTLVKLENTTQMQIAIQRPRNEDRILTAAKAELDRYPSMADEAIYSKPAGKDKDTGNMKYVEGLSIRAAEALANRWSNSAYGCDIVGEDKDAIYIAAVFMDYENNTRHVISRRVSKTYKKSGSMVVIAHPPDRLDMKVAAEMSKGLREVILRSLAPGLKKEYEFHAYKVLDMQPVDQRRLAIVARFKEVGVKKDAIEAKIGKKIEDLDKEDLITLTGLLNAIREGEISAQETMGIEPPKEEGVIGKGVQGLKDALSKEKEQPKADPAAETAGTTGEPTDKKPGEGLPFGDPTDDVPKESSGIPAFMQRATSRGDADARWGKIEHLLPKNNKKVVEAYEKVYSDVLKRFAGGV
jgi:hypothetical protein